ncbi:T9SS type A sorting domain-containing protein [candidate division KSB1 bacterium]|nr:T9SS type A sorting domain-containing protein [candidate division KSB1 bacterium]MBL7094624.1 T9SS type A sorting domain-containing protein [candidate division KSB1 bacterium]
MISKIITTIRFYRCIMTTLFLLFYSYNANAQNYTVGVPVCDTIVANMELDYAGEFMLIQLDSALVSYVTGLNFKVKITDVNGFVFSNVKDTLQVGDMLTLPADSDTSVLKINVPGKNNFIKFDILIVGNPLVAGEVYYCNISSRMTTAVYGNTLEVYVENEESCIVQPNTSIDHEYDENVPGEFKLNQNYPNPFNSQTIIQYQLKKLADIKINIYNLLGKKIKILANINQSPGKYSLVWDGYDSSGSPVSSGLYMYEMFVDSKFVEGRKMLLLQ